jgi:hypothetical protein
MKFEGTTNTLIHIPLEKWLFLTFVMIGGYWQLEMKFSPREKKKGRQPRISPS